MALVIKITLWLLFVLAARHEPYEYVPPAEAYISDTEFEPKQMHVTFYIAQEGAKNAMGKRARLGTIAANQHIGETAALYSMDKEFICFMEVEDCGSADWLVNDTCIDIYISDISQMKYWVDAYGTEMYVQFIDSKG